MVRLSGDTYWQSNEDWVRARDTLSVEERKILVPLAAQSVTEVEAYLKENFSLLSGPVKHFLLESLRRKSHHEERCANMWRKLTDDEKHRLGVVIGFPTGEIESYLTANQAYLSLAAFSFLMLTLVKKLDEEESRA